MPAAATGFNGDGFGDKITNRRMDAAAGDYDYLNADEEDGDPVPLLAVPGAAALTLNHGDTEPIKDTAASGEEIGAETRGDDGDGDTDTTNTTDTPDTATDTPDSATNTPDTGDGGDEDKKLSSPPPPPPRPVYLVYPDTEAPTLATTLSPAPAPGTETASTMFDIQYDQFS